MTKAEFRNRIFALSAEASTKDIDSLYEELHDSVVEKIAVKCDQGSITGHSVEDYIRSLKITSSPTPQKQ